MKCVQFVKSQFRMLLCGAAVLAMSCCLHASASDCSLTIRTSDRKALADSIRLCLASARTAADSIPILYDLLDLASFNEIQSRARQLYFTAKRAKNPTVQLDALRYWGNNGAAQSNDTIVREAMRGLKDIPDSEDKAQTKIFLKACEASAYRFRNESERNALLSTYLREFNDNGEHLDPHTQASQLFTLVSFFSGGLNGQMLTQYLDKLERVINNLPKNNIDYLRNKFNSQAAIGYLYSDEPQKSIDADRDQLKNIEQMEMRYKAIGRNYKNYDVQRYVIIRRMMRNYMSLTDAEVDSLYSQVLAMCDRNADIASDFARNPSVRVGMLLKKGRYEEALPLVRQQADEAVGVINQRLFLRRLIDVAAKAGADDIKREAEARNSELLENYISHKTAERTRELQILYDVNALRQENADAAIARERTRVIALIVIGILASTLAVVFFVLYRRYHRATLQLAHTNRRLKAEQANLLRTQQDLISARDSARNAETEKSQLITYVGHEVITPLNAIVEYSQIIIDYAGDDGKKYLRKFADIIDVNSRIIKEIANDIQNFSMIDAHKLTIHRSPVNVNTLGDITADSIRSQVGPDVKLVVNHAEGNDTCIITDPHRVGTVLLALLSNAAKFTDKGTITLDISVDSDNDTATFAVTDTGIGIPADKADKIFERFERLNPEMGGAGLGLANSAMIAKALKADLRLDTSHRGGARFIFTIPTK